MAVTIAGYKSPGLARELSGRLNAMPVEHRLLTEFQERSAYLALLTGSRVAVCLPNPAEGFYLPALEAMALGCVVVTVDCIGNRGFCHHEVNCLIAERCPDALLDMTKRALAMSAPERARMHRRARDTAARHSLDAERERFHAILKTERQPGSSALARSRPGRTRATSRRRCRCRRVRPARPRW